MAVILVFVPLDLKTLTGSREFVSVEVTYKGRVKVGSTVPIIEMVSRSSVQKRSPMPDG